MSRLRGQGDRWLAGEPVEGVEFEQHASVELISGPFAGRIGSIVLLMNLEADPVYLVALGVGAGEVRVRQSAMRRTS
jgi:transcription antitermination factor NusG